MSRGVDFRALLASAERGELGSMDRLCAERRFPAPERAGWRACGEALAWLARGGAPPEWPDLAAAHGEVEGAAEAQALHARAALLRFDANAWKHVLATQPPSLQASGWTELCVLWDEAAAGTWSTIADRADAIRRHAAATGDASLVLESTALRAFALIAVGDIDDGLEVARRASRMARTEALPQQEYLANIVLARARRLSGRPHLATSILSSLRRFASSPWHGWIDWELTMAGGAAGMPVEAASDVSSPAATLRRLLLASASGATAGVESGAATLQTTVAAWPWLRSDVDLVLTVLLASSGDRLPETLRARVRAWQCGADRNAPLGLMGLCDGSVDGAYAFVLAEPDGSARRTLDCARGLQTARCAAEVLPATAGGLARADALLAALALAGPEGIDESRLFQTVWNLAWVPELHADVLNVALHRARTKLAERGKIERTKDALTLTLHAPLLIPDPRSAPPADHRVLHFVARQPRATATDIADALGIPLRTVQLTLKDLVTAGFCRRERDGRTIAYQVEDTTFQEPTRR